MLLVLRWWSVESTAIGAADHNALFRVCCCYYVPRFVSSPITSAAAKVLEDEFPVLTTTYDSTVQLGGPVKY